MNIKRGAESGYRKDSTEQLSNWEENGKIVEITSGSVDYKYLLCSANNPEYVLENYKIDYSEHLAGKYKYLEVYEIIKYGDAKIGIIAEKLGLSTKDGYEKEKARIIRASRGKYININLSGRLAHQDREDVMSGVEDIYINRFSTILHERDSFKNYLKGIDKIKLKIQLKK